MHIIIIVVVVVVDDDVVIIVVVVDVAEEAVDATMSIGDHGMDIFMSFPLGIISLLTFNFISSSRRSIPDCSGGGSSSWPI